MAIADGSAVGPDEVATGSSLLATRSEKLGGARVVEGTVGVGWAGLGRGYPAWRRTSPRRAAGAEAFTFNRRAQALRLGRRSNS